MKSSDSIKDLAAALAKAQAIIKGAAKDAQNPHFKSRYADLASIWEACREALTSNGLSVVQGGPETQGGVVTIDTRLMHSSGQWIESSLSAPAQQNNAQGVGSAVTYLRRYSLAAICGVAPDDDDGEAAVGRGVQMGVTATGKPVRAKIDIVTGEVKDKKPEWTKEQTAEAGALRAEILSIGPADADAQVRKLWNDHKYSAASDTIDALGVMLSVFRDVHAAAQEK